MDPLDKKKFERLAGRVQPDDPMYQEYEYYFTIKGLSQAKIDKYKIEAARQILGVTNLTRSFNFSKLRDLPVERLIELKVLTRLLYEAMEGAGLNKHGTVKRNDEGF